MSDETYTHRAARIRSNFNASNTANGGVVQNCWDYLTPMMQKVFIDRELKAIIEEEEAEERRREGSQFGAGA